MSSDSSTAVPSQQSTKAYVDNNVGSANYTPTSYAGEESITFPNGMIMKQGTVSVGVNTTATVTFGTAFPSACTSAWLTLATTNSFTQHALKAHTLTTTTMKVTNPDDAFGADTTNWFAIGY